MSNLVRCCLIPKIISADQVSYSYMLNSLLCLWALQFQRAMRLQGGVRWYLLRSLRNWILRSPMPSCVSGLSTDDT